MAKDKSRFSDSQNSKKEAANRPNPSDTSNTFDISEVPSPPQKNTRPQTTRPNLPSRPEPQAILPDRLNSRPSRPRSNPGNSRPPIYRPGSALPDSNETIPGETSSPRPAI
ncbi:MAG TPA: hypothetical protein VFN23_15050, partial [Ktedonobacteraceae bacterium]|nr:hypothetical protein [Ktedonobacteraceae bacterium]